MNNFSSQLRVRQGLVDPQLTGNLRASASALSCRLSHSHPEFPRSFVPGFPAGCGLFSRSEPHISSQLRRTSGPKRNCRARSLVPVNCGRRTCPNGLFPANCGKFGAHRSLFESSCLARTRFVQLGSRPYTRSPQLAGRFPAVGCKKARSRMEKPPQSTGRDGPQLGGTCAAAGWKLVRSWQEKIIGYPPFS